MRLVTLYKTSSPGVSIKSGEYYQLALDNPDGRGFILKESHGNWDGVKGEKVPGGSSEILSPPDGYLSSEEATLPSTSGKCFERDWVSCTASYHLQSGNPDPGRDLMNSSTQARKSH